jgi:hypothetical protein
MIDYKIVKVDWINKVAQIRYSKTNCEDYYIATTTSEIDFTEEWIHNQAAERVQEAVSFWDAVASIEVMELESDGGTLEDVVYEPEPDWDPSIERLQPNKTVADDGTITYGWTKVPLDAQQIGANIRMQRDELLHHSDHYALSDRTLSTEMAEYRQALRDITDQETFPNSVTWPTEPID